VLLHVISAAIEVHRIGGLQLSFETKLQIPRVP
jgi:hypothetical protein